MQHLIFDATPTVACLDFCAERVARMNPDAKLVFMLRDPVSAAFSAEIMVRRRWAAAVQGGAEESCWGGLHSTIQHGTARCVRQPTWSHDFLPRSCATWGWTCPSAS